MKAAEGSWQAACNAWQGYRQGEMQEIRKQASGTRTALPRVWAVPSSLPAGMFSSFHRTILPPPPLLPHHWSPINVSHPTSVFVYASWEGLEDSTARAANP